MAPTNFENQKNSGKTSMLQKYMCSENSLKISFYNWRSTLHWSYTQSLVVNNMNKQIILQDYICRSTWIKEQAKILSSHSDGYWVIPGIHGAAALLTVCWIECYSFLVDHLFYLFLIQRLLFELKRERLLTDWLIIWVVQFGEVLVIQSFFNCTQQEREGAF